MKNLFSCSDPAAWEQAFEGHENAMKVVSSSGKKAKMHLESLERWFLHDLPTGLRHRKPPHILKGELSKLMTWKLSRGKWRPNLQKFVDNLSDVDVERATMSAFSHIDNPEVAVGHLCELKGVGPATASAILSCFDSSYPFMSDEALESVMEGSRKYTSPVYLELRERLIRKAEHLNDETGDDTWTAKRVELALWSHSVSPVETVKDQGTKRKGGDQKQSGRKRRQGNAEGPATKK